MKKITLILTLIFTTSLYSQYNLQFSRVVNEQLNANNQMVTVPDGKVWKIQGFFSNGTGNTNSPDHYSFSITKPDGTYLSYRYFYANSMANQTIWASEGDKITMAGSLPNSSNIMALNALEFNLSSATSSGGGSGDSGSGGSGSSSSSSVSYTDNSGFPDDDFTDLDGNTYGTTNINGMIWTTSNYEGSTYSDGTAIPYISDWDEWKEATTGAYTYWVQDASLGYGKLYNLHALRGRHDDDDSTPYKVFAPDGWHLPNKGEIEYIHNLYSTNPDINIQSLKSQTGWFAGTNGTNISGLDVKPYPSIYNSSNENLGFTSTSSITNYQYDVGGSTYFATSSPYTGNPLRMNYALYIGIDGGSAGGAQWSYTPFLAASVGGTQNNEFNDGLYIRLIKDYN